MNILLVGAGGYATGYVKELLSNRNPSVIWAGVVDPYYDACAKKAEIDAAGIPVYASMEEFYAEHTADLTVICTPPHLHREQSLCALAHGSYVLCEKPVAPTVAEAQAMREGEEHYGRWIAVGYQWSFSQAIRDLKRDILAGALGKPLGFKTAISWPRDLAYYGRGTGWAGRIERNGHIILDSIASNACAHYLHNMLFLLGERMERSAEADEAEAVCLRANAIENFDTCSIRMHAGGVPLYFIASHAAGRKRNPEFVYRFARAVVTFAQDEGSEIVATFDDGSVKRYGDPFANNFSKLWDCVAAVRDGSVPICTVATATAHTKVIERLWRECHVRAFPRETVRFDEAHDRVYVEGLFEAMYRAYENEEMLGIE